MEMIESANQISFLFPRTTIRACVACTARTGTSASTGRRLGVSAVTTGHRSTSLGTSRHVLPEEESPSSDVDFGMDLV